MQALGFVRISNFFFFNYSFKKIHSVKKWGWADELTRISFFRCTAEKSYWPSIRGKIM